MTRAEAYADLITFMCGAQPPFEFPADIERLGELPDAQYELLQGFVADHVHLPWLTGIGVLEAVDHMVDEAISNSEVAFQRAIPGIRRKPRMGDAEILTKRGKQ